MTDYTCASETYHSLFLYFVCLLNCIHVSMRMVLNRTERGHYRKGLV